MKRYFVEITDAVEYEVEARDQNEAINRAFQWWDERMPNIKVSVMEEVQKEKENDYEIG